MRHDLQILGTKAPLNGGAVRKKSEVVRELEKETGLGGKKDEVGDLSVAIDEA